ncbi:MAG: hypothetical protein JSU57_03630, partial [Candidatus Heimdallarchaeota archaeon]
ISWTATDLDPATYTVYLDGAFNTSGSWTSGNAFLVDIDGLAVGLYNFTVVCVDASGNSNSDTVWVTVEETTSTHEETTEEITSGFDSSTSAHEETTEETTSGFDFSLLLIIGAIILIYRKR